MRILVTGANGFVGSWISNSFSELGHEVKAVVRPTADLARLTPSNNLEVVIMEPNLWANYLIEASPDTVILSDWAGVAGSEAQSRLQAENVTRWHSLGMAANIARVKNFIAFGSQAEIGVRLTNVTEEWALNPVTNYGRAKLDALNDMSAMFDKSQTRFIWARIFTVYGPFDNPSWLIPSAIRALHANQTFETTKGEQNWNYLYIEDLCLALLRILETPNLAGVINLANPDSVKLVHVLTSIETIMGKQGLIKFGAIPYSKNQIMDVTPSVSKLGKSGWKPKFDLNLGLKLTIESFLETFV